MAPGEARPTPAAGTPASAQAREGERAAAAAAAAVADATRTLLDGTGDQEGALMQLSRAITEHALGLEVARAGAVTAAVAVLQRALGGRPASAELLRVAYNFAFDFAATALETAGVPAVEGVLESCMDFSLALLHVMVQHGNLELAREAPMLMRQVLRLARKRKDKGALAARVVADLEDARRDDLVAAARLVKLAQDSMLARTVLDVLLRLGALNEGGRLLLGEVLREAGFKDRDLRDLDDYFGTTSEDKAAVVTRWVTRLEEEGGRSTELAATRCACAWPPPRPRPARPRS
jgi:hypothetical protein